MATDSLCGVQAAAKFGIFSGNKIEWHIPKSVMMKNPFLILILTIILWGCNNHNTTPDKNADSLATNPHGIPSHVDTITHEDGLSNQSGIPDTSANSRDTMDPPRK